MNVFWPSITHSCAASSSIGARARRARVGAGLGFGEPERAEHLARDHRDEVLLLLRLGARVEERRRAEAHARLERDRHRRVDPRELLDREAVGEVVGAAAAVLLRERQAEQPEPAHREHRVDRETVVAVPVGGVRRDLGRRRTRARRCGTAPAPGSGRSPRSRPYPRPLPSSRVRAPARIRPASVLRHLPSDAAARSCATARPRSSARDPPSCGRRAASSVRRVARDRRAAASGSGSARTTSGAPSNASHTRTVDDLHLPDVAFARYDARLVIHDDGDLELVGDRDGRARARRGRARARATIRSSPPRRRSTRGRRASIASTTRPRARACSSCCARASATR